MVIKKEEVYLCLKKNIKNVFIGSIYQDKVDVVLNYIENVENLTNQFQEKIQKLKEEIIDERNILISNLFCGSIRLKKRDNMP